MFHQRRLTIPFPTLSLSFVKAVKSAAKATVNDVLLSVTAGAIRRYCLLMGDPLFSANDTDNAAKDGVDSGATSSNSKKEEVRVRALIPVAFPRPMVDTGALFLTHSQTINESFLKCSLSCELPPQLVVLRVCPAAHQPTHPPGTPATLQSRPN